MSNGISSERQLETAVRQTAALLKHAIEQKQDVVVVAGPVVVHTGGAPPLADLIRRGYVQALLSGNALGVHDAEAALLGTSLGVRMADGRQEEHGHRNHMRAINTIYHCGSIRQAVENGCLRSGILYECVKCNVPFVLAGSLRDDGGIVYLNDTEIFRSNMTNAPVVYSTNWAVTAVGGADESTFFTTNVNPALLINGTNLLAVEIHQQSATSSDVSFDLRLTALSYLAPTITFTAAGPPFELAWPALPGGFVLESSPGLAPGAIWTLETSAPLVVTNGFNKVSVELESGSRFYRVTRR